MTAIAFSEEEYRTRIDRVQTLLSDRELDGLLLHAPENILYLSGYQTSGYFAYQSLLVPATGDPVIIVRDIEVSNVFEYTRMEAGSVLTYTDIDDPLELTARAVRHQGIRRLGVEKTAWFLTVREFDGLQDRLARVEFADASQLVDRLRVVKSPAEIAYLRRAASVVSAGMLAAFSAIRDGASELEVAAEVHRAEILLGCEYVGLPHFISSGYRVRLGHANWSERAMESGDPVHLELSGCIRRYSAALMRTASVGAPTTELARTAELVIESQNAALALMKPGAKAGDVDAAGRNPVIESGLRPDYRQRTGYSIGLGFPPKWGEWDVCDFRAGDTWALEAGMVFHMILSARGVCFSETVLITEDGHELLTAVNRELFVN